jgi:proteic killer suppression protein
MRIVFRNPKLALLRGAEVARCDLPAPVIKSFLRKLVILEAAPDERTLRNWKSLHFEKLAGDRSGQRSIRLNDQWRLVFLLVEDPPPPTLELLDIEDYH